MPVDIRSFFSKKAPTAAAAKNKKSNAALNEEENKKNDSKVGNDTTKKPAVAAVAKPKPKEKQSSTDRTTTKKDKGTTATSSTVTASGGKRKQAVHDVDKSSSNGATISKNKAKNEAASSTTTTTNKREVSVADFFASSKNKTKSTSSKTRADETDGESTSPSPPPYKRTKPSPSPAVKQQQQQQQQQHTQEAEEEETIDLSKDTDDDDDYFNTIMKDDSKQKSKNAVNRKHKEADDSHSPHSTTKRKRGIAISKNDDDDDDDDDDNDADFHVESSSGNDDDDDDYEQVDEKNKKKKAPTAAPTPSNRKTSPRRPTPTKQTLKAATTTNTTTTSASKRAKKTPENAPPPTHSPTLVPELQVESIDLNAIANAAPECLANKTFVFTGILSDSCSRDDAVDLVKTLGGRVTGQVSGKTDYLVIGEVLEDGRPYTEGSKYKKAISINNTNAAAASNNSNTKRKNPTTPHQVHLVIGEQALYGLAQQYRNAAGGTTTPASANVVKKEEQPRAVASEAAVVSTTLKKAPPPAAAAAVASKPMIVNPYAKAIVNPYAKKSTSSSGIVTGTNPYAKKTSVSSNNIVVDDRKPAAATASVVASVQQAKQPGGLWVDRYKPTSSKDILGNSDAVNKLAKWLMTWEKRFNHSSVAGKTFSNPNGPWKAALLSGPPGIGKTTTATLVALEAGRDVIEFNASDVRSKKAMHDQMGDITGSQTIQFQSTVASGRSNKKAPKKLRCIIMDEVDGMGAGDRSGVAELIQMIKKTKVPIIAICNDRQNQKLKSLIPYCMDLRYKRPMKTQIATRAMQVAAQEGWNIEKNAAEAIAESCGNDVRQVLNCLQMWASDNSTDDRRMTYKGIKDREKSINKDEVLRISLFDAARILLEGRRGLTSAAADPATERDHFMRRNDAFFVDYSFTGLLVQQNYLKVVQGAFNEAKRANNDKTVEVLERMADAAGSMSDFALAEQSLRADQNWSVLPFVGALVVKTGFHAGGESGGFVPGFPEFTTWLGRNSTKGKKSRFLHELRHHMNYHISCGTDEMRMSYVPVLRNRFLSLVSANDENNMSQAISLMDDYGLDRDDIFEKLDEFNMNPNDKGFSQIDSKKKAAFTRTYNAASHTSQVLVAEQGAGAKKKRKASSSLETGETIDPDAIDDDKQAEAAEEEDEDDEDVEKLAAAFLKKGRKKAATAKKATTSKPKPKGKKKK